MSWLKKVFSKNKDEATSSSTSSETKGSLFRLRAGLKKTRQAWSLGITSLLLGKKELSAELLEELESHLLAADVGVEMTRQIIDPLVLELERKTLQNGDLVFAAMKEKLTQYLLPICNPIEIKSHPFIVLAIGVNGVGKTTTLAKLARKWQLSGKSVMLAAGDTFRAAAVEQLKHWGQKYQIPVVAQGVGADSAAVIYDAYQSAKAKGVDILLADTAGRLHTQDNLMSELKKIKRVLNKIDNNISQETLLILDASIGQNALRQAKMFHEAIGVTGIVLTKLDGTAKGGIVFSLARSLAIPLRYIGVGEDIEDLREFDAKDFVEAIFTEASSSA